MKPFCHLPVAAMLTAFGGVALAQNQPVDPLHSLLVPPDLLIQHREQLGLSQEQIGRIRERVENVASSGSELDGKQKQAMGRLVQLLSAEIVDEEAALRELDQVLAAEKELKHLHLRLLIQIRNELTAEQRLAVGRIKQASTPGNDLEQRLKTKIARIEQEVQSRAQAGQPPVEAIGLMQKFPELMQNGQAQAAEAVLDRVFEMLELKGTSDKPRPKQENSPKPSTPDDAQKTQTGLPRLPQAEIVAQVEGLKEEKVAWREIAWKTCLLDGIKASRERNKPIMLWIFIDRPIDDERC